MGKKRIFLLSILPLFIISFHSPILAQTGGTAALPPRADQASRTNIAVMTLRASSGVTEGEAEIITDRLRAELFNTGMVNIMERDQMQAILKEQGFQQSGACTDQACMVEMGKLLGVQQMYTGSIGKIGSIFMINLRIIDVQTGQVLRAVSRDINGMEVVVSNLPGISQELVGLKPVSKRVAPTPAPGPAPAPQPKAEPRQLDRRRPEPTPQPVAPAAKPEVQPAKPVVKQAAVIGPEQEKSDKNKNRFGLRISYGMFPGETWWYFKMPGFPQDTVNQFFDTIHSMWVMGPDLKLVIPIGPVLSIDLGAAYSFSSQRFSDTTGENVLFRNRFFSLGGGFNFVKRWYPLKLNLGFQIGWNFFSSKNSAIDISSSWTTVDFFENKMGGLALGGRGGLELLAGKHVGFSADFIYRHLIFKYSGTDPDFSPYEKADLTVKIPALGFAFGINTYF